MNWEAVGAVGEVLGATGVVITLGYLAVQIRQNTQSMKEGRRLALAQTYQMRADALQSMVVRAASSELGGIIVKLTDLGYPENVAALDELTSEEKGRFRLWQIAQQTHWDNMFFQYQQGYLDEEYYEEAFKERVERLTPTWEALGLTQGRASFIAEMRNLAGGGGTSGAGGARAKGEDSPGR